MGIFLVGVSCVGKSTIGKCLAQCLKYEFYDLDAEVEKFFKTSIARVKAILLSEYTFRKKSSFVLKKLIDANANHGYVVALPPSGLRDCFARLLRRTPDTVTIALHDSPENILKRAVFYDDNSKLIEPSESFFQIKTAHPEAPFGRHPESRLWRDEGSRPQGRLRAERISLMRSLASLGMRGRKTPRPLS
ncbi:MAG: hypothetical protein A3G87_09310 [Omnitrophica bacterium RIFCSPLOWO2_12_FULL_50_11]|nr:MAG: hypothetical protein A3G87_09310 [Omnitrophica bacterium RIFCSPLOWO2_12_FULL_50_11]